MEAERTEDGAAKVLSFLARGKAGRRRSRANTAQEVEPSGYKPEHTWDANIRAVV